MESLDVIQIANTFAGRNENRMKNFGIFTMPTYKEQQILDKVCKVTRQKQIKYYDFIPFFDFQYEKFFQLSALPLFTLLRGPCKPPSIYM